MTTIWGGRQAAPVLLTKPGIIKPSVPGEGIPTAMDSLRDRLEILSQALADFVKDLQGEEPDADLWGPDPASRAEYIRRSSIVSDKLRQDYVALYFGRIANIRDELMALGISDIELDRSYDHPTNFLVVQSVAARLGYLAGQVPAGHRDEQQIKLQVIEVAAVGTRPVISVVGGDGTLILDARDPAMPLLICGHCEAPLVAGIDRLSWGGRVLQCNGCKSYNDPMLLSAGEAKPGAGRERPDN
jgi:hypothetical protein